MAGIRKVLYFIKGSSPTKEEIENALKCGTQMFRNAHAVTSFDFIEPCDGVAGAVPDRYKRFPRVDVVAEPKKEEPKPVIPAEPVAPAVAPIPTPPWKVT